MGAQAIQAERFVRRTRLGRDEYRKNFRQLDCEAIDAVSSQEADAVTPLMSKVYLRLANAPDEYWEREGVLRFAGEERDGQWVTAWGQLVSLAGVASATARKALLWMHAQGVVGYYAGKNGVGIRVFLNRAASSIGRRVEPGQKNLRLVPASADAPRTSAGDTPFNDSFAGLEILETDLSSRAPKNGAEAKSVGKTLSTEPRQRTFAAGPPEWREEGEPAEVRTAFGAITVTDIVERLKVELEPRMTDAAAHAAARSIAREMERTREWFEAKALPKAVRVAQRETFDLLRRQGGVGVSGRGGSAGLEVGRGGGNSATSPARALTPEEVRETAEICVALHEAQGKSIELTIYEISADRGGWLLPEDAPRVHELARELAHSWGK